MYVFTPDRPVNEFMNELTLSDEKESVIRQMRHYTGRGADYLAVCCCVMPWTGSLWHS